MENAPPQKLALVNQDSVGPSVMSSDAQEDGGARTAEKIVNVKMEDTVTPPLGFVPALLDTRVWSARTSVKRVVMEVDAPKSAAVPLATSAIL